MSEFKATLPSPVGLLQLVATERGLSAIRFMHRGSKQAEQTPGNRILSEAQRQLTAYFSGKLKTFSIELDWRGTAFQESVWQALSHIPYGDTVTYADIARSIGRPRSARPVGGAVGKNPLPIVVPCHRVIGSDQTLTGFTGGLDIKIQLLQLEGRQVF